MFNLKNVYFYFLAVKIVTVNFIREFYFKTNFYLKSLKSKIPEQLYFYPNPFLLSSFIKNKNFSFKINDLDANTFWENYTNKKEKEDLNNFYWLNLISRKDDSFILQKIILIWIEKNTSYEKDIWVNTIISKRVISWILNADMILNNSEKSFRKKFFESLIIQINHLKKNIHYENNPIKKIEILSAIILSGLVFKEYETNFKIGTKELKRLVEDFYDNDGFPLSRNIYDLVQSSKFLILIKECCKDAQEYIPDYLDDIVDKIIICLNSVKTPDDNNPLFNGASEFKIKDFYEYLAGLDYKPSETKKLIGQIYVLNNKKVSLFFDVGPPPKKKYSRNYQCGTFSFEYYSNENKIITNCGYGNRISKKIEQISRLTSAQSCLTLNDTSIIKFEKNKLLNNVFGQSIKNSFKVYDLNFEENKNFISVSAKHNAYENNFGYVHKRLVKLEKKEGNLIGEDSLILTKPSKTENNYNIRFHLYPGISAVQTIGGKTILIQIKKNKSLMFTTNGDNLSVEKSVFLGKNKITNNFCINIFGTLKNASQKIAWELKKNN